MARRDETVQGDLITQRPQYQVMEKSYLPNERLGVSTVFDPSPEVLLATPGWPKTLINKDDPTEGETPAPMLIFYDGIPGKNLKPHNAAAKRAWMDEWGRPYDEVEFMDPIRDLTIINKTGPLDLKNAVVEALTTALLPVLAKSDKDKHPPE